MNDEAMQQTIDGAEVPHRDVVRPRVEFYSITLLVQCDQQPAARDLANGIQAAVASAQRRGLHGDVTIVTGPTVAAMQNVRP